jgi:anhydro-N-acetylmuramic acid kinase
MRMLAAELGTRTVGTTADHGVAVEHVEALAFAWLARETIAGRPGNLPAATGARGLRVLGAIYPR